MEVNRISEDWLQYIWKYRYYNQRELATEAGASVFVHYPGDANSDQGPDFTNARISISDRTLVGPVEVHVKTSDFIRHGHAGDAHYKDIILHVVWFNDTSDAPEGIPILVLGGRVPREMTSGSRHPWVMSSRLRYMTERPFVPCAALLAATPGSFEWPMLRDRLLQHRLGDRTAFIQTLLDENNPHWESVLFQLIARSLGQPVNSDAFLTIARGLRLKDLLRLRNDPPRIERMLLDQASRLPQPLSLHRMRPAHSPPVRLRQLAGLLRNHSGRFTLLLESDHPTPVLETLATEGLGWSMRHSILINAFVPLLFTYGSLRQEPIQRNKAFFWLHATPPEKNRFIRNWNKLGVMSRSAADTQALLELRKSWCLKKKCLDCAIGQSLLHSSATSRQPVRPSPAS